MLRHVKVEEVTEMVVQVDCGVQFQNVGGSFDKDVAKRALLRIGFFLVVFKEPKLRKR